MTDKSRQQLSDDFVIAANALLMNFVMGNWDDDGELLEGAASTYIQAAMLPMVMFLERAGASGDQIQAYMEEFLEKWGTRGLKMGFDAIRLRDEVVEEG